MATLLERVAIAAGERREANTSLRTAIVEAKEVHSWSEIAAAAGMSRGGVVHLAQNGKGESNDG